MALIFTITFFTVFIAALAVLTIPLSSRARVRQSLRQLAVYELDTAQADAHSDFVKRIVWPALQRLSRVAKRLSLSGQAEETQLKLAQAGVRNLDTEQFMSIKLGILAGGSVLYLLVAVSWLVVSGRPPWLGLPLIVLAFFAPDLWLRSRIDDRQRQIRVALADAIDLLTVAIEAGLAFDSALAKIAKNTQGALGEEFGRMLGELQIGISRRDAFRNLADRTTLPELQSFCSTLVQADTLGVSIGKVLRTEAGELRTRRRQAAEEAAMKLPVKIVFPIILCILPALLIVILGPGIISIAGALLKLS